MNQQLSLGVEASLQLTIHRACRCGVSNPGGAASRCWSCDAPFPAPEVIDGTVEFTGRIPWLARALLYVGRWLRALAARL